MIKIFKLFFILIAILLTIQFSFANEITISDFSWTSPDGVTTKFKDSDLITIKIAEKLNIAQPSVSFFGIR